MDCGPASLKCLLEGFGTSASYGRLREACQTAIDGTSIDTMEVVANQLGLEAEQIMVPADHLLVAEANVLPGLVVVKLPNGLTHFVVVWRLHRNIVQLMDPAVGRRWTRTADFLKEVYSHTLAVSAAEWRGFAASEDFQRVLGVRLDRIGVSKHHARTLACQVLREKGWHALAALDASVRMTASLMRAGGIGRPRNAIRLIEQLCANPRLVPARYWSVCAANGDGESEEQVLMRGAVLVRIRGKRTAPVAKQLAPELQAAIEERPIAPGRELIRLVRESGRAAPVALVVALTVGAGAVVIEALLFRALFEIGRLSLPGQRITAIAAVLHFSFSLLLLEMPIFSGAARLGRQIENRLRLAFFSKLPKLGDQYFRSRLTSDMAERSHAMHCLRHLPELARQMLRSTFELCVIAAAIIWLDPAATPFVILAVAGAVLPAFLTQSVLAERDLRVRSHAAGLARFYLDAMLGLIAIRAHSAEQSVQKEHDKLLHHWRHAAFRLQNAVVSAETVQMSATFGVIATLLLFHPLAGANIGRVLLIVYWALSLPSLAQEIASLTRQYPYHRNLTFRLLDPLGAPEEPSRKGNAGSVVRLRAAPCIEFRNVHAEASGHKILEAIEARIEPGSHVAIVGPSGAGKSSLIGVLLGCLKPSQGEVLVDGAPLDCDELRGLIAWVDPAVQLWNRSLFSNLCYGSNPDPIAVAQTIDAASLRAVMSTLPEGLQTKLGEGGGLVSGGEGQRVRFGRAMYRKDARIALLDEPFRGLDREKRRELLARARQYWRNSTLLCITHDISETQDFDCVLVIERGRIVENGTPEDLCASPGSRYASLLDAEEQTRSKLWYSSHWRRIRIQSGRIVEQHKGADEKRRDTEVA